MRRIFKKGLSVFLSLLMVMSSFAMLTPDMFMEAEAATTAGTYYVRVYMRVYDGSDTTIIISQPGFPNQYTTTGTNPTVDPNTGEPTGINMAGFTLYYNNVNGTGGSAFKVQDISAELEEFTDVKSDIREEVWEEDVNTGTDYALEVYNFPSVGFPTKLTWFLDEDNLSASTAMAISKITIAKDSGATEHVLWKGLAGSESTNEIKKGSITMGAGAETEGSARYDREDNKGGSWVAPKANTVTWPTSNTADITLSSTGNSVYDRSFGYTVYDQYGVKMATSALTKLYGNTLHSLTCTNFPTLNNTGDIKTSTDNPNLYCTTSDSADAYNISVKVKDELRSLVDGLNEREVKLKLKFGNDLTVEKSFKIYDPKHTITFDNNADGTTENLTPPSYSVYYGESLASQATFDNKITYPTSGNRPGYTFLGMYDAPEGGELMDVNEEITAAKTYYAHWEPMKYAAVFTDRTGENVILVESDIAHGTAATRADEAAALLNRIEFDAVNHYTLNEDNIWTPSTDSVTGNTFFKPNYTAVPHEFDEGTTIEATCQHGAGIEYKCSDCEYSYVVETSEELGEHIKSDIYIVSTDATCTETGTGYYFCTVCGEVIEEATIPAKGHSYRMETIKDATCDEEGIRRYSCAVCDYSADQAIPLTQHNYVAGDKVEATCNSSAYTPWTCSVCDDTYNEYEGNATTDHEWSWVVGDVTADNKITVTGTCDVCGAVATKTIDVPAIHSFTKVTVTQQPTCVSAGKITLSCADDGCTESYEATLPAIETAHAEYETTYTPAECGKAGSVVVKCKDCQEEISKKEIAALEHSYDYVRVEPTCTDEGSITKTCANCDDVQTETIPAAGHKTVTVEANCQHGGYTKCAVCGEVTNETPATAHDFTGEVTEIAATCTADGIKLTKCANCDAQTAEVLPKTGHSTPTDWTVLIPPSCEGKGYQVKFCSKCNQIIDSEEIAPAGHKTTTETVDATCTEAGYVKVTCSVCGDVDTTVIQPIGHNYDGGVEVTVKDATCTTDGLKQIVCKNGCDVVKEVIIPKLLHTWGVWTVTPSTNTAKGSVSRECEVCGEIETVEIPEGNHNMVKDEAASKAPSCKEEGVTVYKCADANCNVKLELAEPKLQHTVATEEIPATCEEEGYIRTYCSVCDEELADRVTVKKLAHVYVAGTPVAPTCTTSGYTPYTCECGDTYNKYDESQPATGHEFSGTETIIEEATCTTDGSKKVECVACDKTITLVIPKLGHNYVLDSNASTDATCEANGKEIYKCENCGETHEVVLTKLSHNWGAWEVIPSTNTAVGSVSRECADCEATETVEIPAGGHDLTYRVITEPTCEATGEAVFECTAHNGCDIEKEITLPALGHDKKVTYTAATCTDAGSIVTTCNRCSEDLESETIPALGHAWGNETVTPATCQEKGKIEYTCTRTDCNETHEVEIPVDADAHNLATTVTDATCTTEGSVVTECINEGCDYSKPIITIEAKGHTITVEVTNPKCGVEGSVVETCSVCGEEKVTTIPALKHSYTSTPIVKEAPTCTEEGLSWVVCAYDGCDSTIEVVIPKIDHSYDEGQRFEADCTSGAYTTYTCKVCGHTELVVEEGSTSVGHNFIETGIIPPTCTTTGEKTLICTNGCEAATTVVIEKLPHEWSEWTVTPSTNTAKGSVSRECEACGEIETVEIPEGKHNMVKDEAASKAPSCKEEGVTVYKCADANCNVKLELAEPKLQHTVATEEIPATCTAEGYIRTYCSVCNEELADRVTIKKLAHVYVAGTPVAPTCTTSGYTPYTCECGDTYNMYDETKPATDHNYEEVENSSTATCTAGGTMQLECSACGDEVTADVPALGHDYVLNSSASTDATCAAAATETYKCSRCEASYTISVGDKLTTHSYPDVWTTVKEATLTSIGYKTRACTVCGQIEVEEIPATGDHVFDVLDQEASKAPTCTEDGYEVYGCSAHANCGLTSEVKLPKLGHDEKLVYVAATCTEAGSVKRHCDRCDVDLETETIPALGHAWGNEVIINATCAIQGSITYTCTRTDCNETHKVEIPVNTDAHNLVTTVTDATCTTEGTVVTECTNEDCSYRKVVATIEAKGHTITTEITNPKCGVEGEVVADCEDCDYENIIKIPALNHSYTGTRTEVTAPDCDTDGIDSVACVNDGCTEVTYVIVPKLGHSYDAGQKVDSDCTNGGYTKYTCETCGYVHIELDGTTGSGHDFTGEETIIADPTCTTDGSKTVKCKDCDVTTTVVIPKKGHAMGDWVQTKAPTCTEDGEQQKTCANNCGEKIVAPVSKLGHNWGAWSQTKESTNTEMGRLERTCERGCTEYVDIPAGGHVLAVHNTLSKEPSCTQEGLAVFVCTVHLNCGVKAELTLDKTQHAVTTTKKAATCTSDGYIKTYCSVCDEVFSEEPTQAIAHDYVAGTPVAPTCTSSGYTPYKCSKCDSAYNLYDADADATKHNYEEVEDSSTATCTAGGTMTLKCSECGDEVTAEVPALGHDYEAGATTNATCAAAATVTYKCSRCEASYTISVGDKLTTHSYPNDWTIVEQATNTSIGYKTRACTVCGQIEVEVIPATGEHVFDVLDQGASKAPTCTEDGYEIYGCSAHVNCNLTSTVKLPKLGHDEKLVYTPATCEGEGSAKGVCDRCSVELESETIPALGHAWGNEVVTKATCAAQGSITYTCTRGCGATNTVDLEIDETAHSYTTTVNDATCTSTGSVVETCKYCGDSKTTTLAQKGHIWKDEPTSTDPATCTTDGKAIYDCENCGATHEVTLAKLGHDWGEWTVVQPTAVADGSVSRVCSRGCEESVVIPKGNHNMSEVTRTDATCTSTGSIYYVCDDNCGIVLTVTLDKLEHSINTITLAPTCSKDGYVREVCAYNCGYEKMTVTPATGEHTLGEWTVVENPTCVNDGIMKRECSKCFGEDEYDVIPATGEHTYNGNWTTVYEATCESSGVEKDVCVVCATASVTRPTDPIGHELVTATTAATCEVDGLSVTTCKNGCDYRVETAVPKIGHDYEMTASTDANCTEAPTETWTCKNDASHTYTIITGVPTGHDYGTGTVITQANCTEPEVTRYVCAGCGDSYDVITAVPNGHKYTDNWQVITAVTATVNGEMVRYCTVCNAAPEYATVPATGAHEFVKGDYVAPDCETEGSQEWICTTHNNCEANYTEAIPAAGHKLDLDIMDATCTATGYVKLVCTVSSCGEEIRSYEVPMLSHTYTEVEGSRQAATCTEPGSYKIACTCGAEQTIVIPAKGHSYSTNSFAATCTHGAKTVYTCDCGDTYTITTSDPLGHDWGEWVETKEATETEAGELTRECKRGCGATETAPLAPTGEHNFVKDTAASIEADCENPGTLVFKCTAEHDCGVTYTHDVAAKGHQLKLDFQQATCTEDGFARVFCTVCTTVTEANVINKLGHKYVPQVTTEAKCGEAGVVTYTCENCGDSYTEDVEALEHNFIVEVVGTKVAPTCIKDGKVTMKCFNCDATEEKVLTKTGHLFDEGIVIIKPDCVTAGKIEYTCQYDHTHKFTEVTNPTGSHTLVGEIVEYPATCLRAARNEQYCEACGNWVVVWESTVAPSHTWNAWVVEKLPTETEDGYQYRICAICGEREEMTLTAGRMIRVIFYNDNGERLTKPTYYTYGSKAERPEDPVKHETNAHTYEFIGWTYGGFDYENVDEEVAETEKMIDYLGYGFDYSKKPGEEGYEAQEGYAKELNCKAAYRAIEKTYKVTYIDGNGKTKVVENVRYDDLTTAYGGVPAKDATNVYTYVFDKWQIICSKDPGTGENIATVTAQYTAVVIPGMEDSIEKEPSIFMKFFNSIIEFFRNLLAKIGIKI